MERRNAARRLQRQKTQHHFGRSGKKSGFQIASKDRLNVTGNFVMILLPDLAVAAAILSE